MTRHQFEHLILGFILMLPFFFLVGFKVHDMLKPAFFCEQACKELDVSYVGCDNNICLCRHEQEYELIHVERFNNGETNFIVECSN